MKKTISYIKLLSFIFGFGALLLAFPVKAQLADLKQEKYKLKNGLQVIFMEYGTLPVTSLHFYINTGKKNETPGLQNISDFTSQALLFGTAKYSNSQIDSLGAIFGGGVSATANDNFTQLSMDMLNSNIETGMDMVASIIMQPTFPKDEIDEMIRETEDYNNTSKMDITDLGSVYSDYFVFGTANPLGRHFYPEQLKKIGVPEIKEFYSFNFTPKNTILVVSGKPDKEKMKLLISKYFDGWQAAYGEVNGVDFGMPEISKKEYAFVNRNNAVQAAMNWTKKGPTINSKDLFAFQIANNAFNEKIFNEVREKEGKTYGIGSMFSVDQNRGVYTISTRVRNEVMYATTQSVDKVLFDFYTNGITEDQLKTIKVVIKNRFLGSESPDDIVTYFNPLLYPDFEKRKAALQAIDNITLEQVNKAIKKYFSPDSYKLVIAGNETDLAPQLANIKSLVKIPLKAIEVDN